MLSRRTDQVLLTVPAEGEAKEVNPLDHLAEVLAPVQTQRDSHLFSKDNTLTDGMRCIRECLARCAGASIPGMSKMWWLAFGAVAAILLCLFYFGGVWTAALLVVVVVVVFLGWKFVAPLFGPAGK